VGSVYGLRKLAAPSQKSNRSYTLTLSVSGLDRGEYFKELFFLENIPVYQN
jgi:hypothetical protein